MKRLKKEANLYQDGMYVKESLAAILTEMEQKFKPEYFSRAAIKNPENVEFVVSLFVEYEDRFESLISEKKFQDVEEFVGADNVKFDAMKTRILGSFAMFTYSEIFSILNPASIFQDVEFMKEAFTYLIGSISRRFVN